MPPSLSLNRRIWMLAWPLLLSNLTAPLLSLVDTAVVGHLDSPRYLAAVAMSGNYFMFLYFSFNFLRMGTTGFTAQARGGTQSTLIVMCRAVLLAAVLGGLLIAVNPWLRDLGLWLLGGSDAVQALAAQYINIRILGAPAALANFALIGFAIGVQRTKVPFKMTLVMHGSNALLSYSLVYIWHFDVAGVAAASALADYLGLAAALYWLRSEFNPAARRQVRELGLLRLQPMLQLVAVNRDLFVRSLALLSVFFFFTAQGARFGDSVLAANAVLITFLLILSNLLDGFANAAAIAITPDGIESKNDILFEALAGGPDIAQRPNLYQPLVQHSDSIRPRIRTLVELDSFNPPTQLQAILKAHPQADGWLPLSANHQDMVVLMQRDSAQVVAIVNLRPWP